MNKEVSNQEILESINDFANQTEKRFDGVESRLNKIEATMVTKDYLDDKLADLRGDLTVLMRKEDTKVRALVDILKERKIITDEDVKKILSMEPFPQIL
ncbi:MAG: hypothetical protein WC460_03940 [Patescibacteria group bacterium]